MNSRTSSAAVALALMMTGSGAHAIGNACKDVEFRVNNNFWDTITVEKFELYSIGEGRYLNENFPNVTVLPGAQNVVVRRGETVEKGEGDTIRDIKVTWTHLTSAGTHRHTTTDFISNGICTDGRLYTATID